MKPKEQPKRTYQSRDEIEQAFFPPSPRKEESESRKSEPRKTINEDTIKKIQQLFRAN
jgi:hypothetical protein